MKSSIFAVSEASRTLLRALHVSLVHERLANTDFALAISRGAEVRFPL